MFAILECSKCGYTELMDIDDYKELEREIDNEYDNDDD